MTWNDYLQQTASHPQPRGLLKDALKYVHARNCALDLGTGNGNDARFLLEQGFGRVDTVDSNPTVAEYLPKDVRFFPRSFDKYEFPEDAYDLVNAQYALPFNPPETFEKMFDGLVASLVSGGVFAGQFFGLEDGWSKNASMTFHTAPDIQRLFESFILHENKEERKLGRTAAGEEKFWHVFHIIAEKKAKDL